MQDVLVWDTAASDRAWAHFPEESKIECIVTSPPYNRGIAYGEDTDREDSYLKKLLDDAMPLWDFNAQFVKTFELLAHKVSPTCALWVNCSSDFEFVSKVIAWLPQWQLQKSFAWVFSATDPEGKSWGHFRANKKAVNPHNGFEVVLLFHLKKQKPIQLDRLALGVPYVDKSNLKRFKSEQDLRCRGNVWCIPYSTKHQTDHPCPFPKTLVDFCIAITNPPDDSYVVDPFMGSGTVGESAKFNGLPFYGVDVAKSYVTKLAKSWGMEPKYSYVPHRLSKKAEELQDDAD